MNTEFAWLGLLAPVPATGGECKRRVLHDPPFTDWVEVRLVLGDDASGLRIVTAMFDADDKPGSVSDMVAVDGGRHQETVSGRVEANGRIQGFYTLIENDQRLRGPLTPTDEEGLRALAAALRQRYR